MLQPIIGNIPAELRQIPQWVCWKAKPGKNGKIDKVPFDPKTGRAASSTDPATWRTFGQAVAASKNGGGYAGIGFVLNGGPFVGVDLDYCRNPETGDIQAWAWEIVQKLNTYTEISPSGKGLRMLLKGELKNPGRRKGKIECYVTGRFLTVTGHRVEGTPAAVMDRQQEILAFHESVFGKQKPPAKKQPPTQQATGLLSDDDIIARAKPGKDEVLARLWAGDISGYPSQSEADQALCNKLAFYTGKDPEQMDRLFRQSGLYRQKWEREDYRNRTIGKAMEDVQEVYTGGRISAEEAFRELDWDGNIIEPGTQSAAKQLPIIQVNNRSLPSLTKHALNALASSNYPPKLFIKDGKIVRVRKVLDKNNKNQAYCRPIIECVDEPTLKGYLARSANYVNVREKKGELVTVPAFPPNELVRDIMAQEDLPFPLLKGIVQAPVFRYDGSLFDKAGYDDVSSLYYLPEGNLKLPRIPAKPGNRDLQAAVNLLRDIVCDFPFDSEASRANILAAIITPVLREFINGCVPLLLIDKPLQGTGASLLADIISIIATGESSYMTTAPEGKNREEEWRKRITSILLEGRLITVIDNVEECLKSATLCAALTSKKWEDRLLGTNKNAYLEHRTCWFATGNNIRLAGDMPRRCYLVRMDAQTAKPWERDTRQFKYPNLVQHVKQNRGALLAAIYTIARAWINAGRPAAVKAPIMGSFEEWRNTIGGILEFVGVNDFLTNNTQIQENAEVNEGIEPFIQAWYETIGPVAVTTKEIKRRMEFGPNSEVLRDALPDWLDPYDRGFTRKLGRVLAKKADVIFTNGLKLVKTGTTDRASLWKVVAT
ncbi:phage NrS-1 polymerase family protein [Desulfolucanica intricata]|uniref:phage NrS-1 polymerase family protein n=1 Tax=Desulfolucanica intricata TaxID=1285191 RepID=UPI0008310B76|nr:hypothetical protein [Desulfolucanica intricata]